MMQHTIRFQQITKAEAGLMLQYEEHLCIHTHYVRVYTVYKRGAAYMATDQPSLHSALCRLIKVFHASMIPVRSRCRRDKVTRRFPLSF